MIRLPTILVVVAGFMIVEARRAARNERAQRERGAVEPANDVYRLMQVAYPGVFLMMIAEGVLRAAPPVPVVVMGAVVFAAGKALKWWAIASLASFWTFRVLVVPGSTAVEGGPYRFMRHPNYVGVAGELAGTALMTGAPIAGSLGTILFIALMAARVRVEDRARDAILRRG